MKKLLFLHGLNWSGACPMADTLNSELKGNIEVIAPDLPVNPAEAIKMILELWDREHPDLIAGSSYGSFLGQQIVKITGCPALLCSPMFRMSEFLETRIGVHDYKSPRADGSKSYEVTSELIKTFSDMEAHQFDCYDEFYRDRVWGFYGSGDTIADTRARFQSLYSKVIEYDGPHTMTSENVKTVLVPAVKSIMTEYPVAGTRYFRHFKGNPYRLMCHAKDSESLDRLVSYQALYGDEGYWVRPEQMFFEQVTRDGRRMPRFAETDITCLKSGVPRLAVFASGDGSNAENIIKYFQRHPFGGEIALVVSNKATAKVLQRAERLNVPAEVLSRDEINDQSILMPVMERYKIDGIILAGFLLAIPPFLIRRYHNSIINIHPALLPKFGGKGMYGRYVHEAVVAAGEDETGITIHYVNEHYDDGEIIFQARIKISPEDTPEKVADMVHELEYTHYPRVIRETFNKRAH